MADLLDEIEVLAELDELRAEAIGLREDAIKGVLKVDYPEDEPGDRIERALCLRVEYLAGKLDLKPQKPPNSRTRWLDHDTRGVAKVTLESLFSIPSGADDLVPVMRAARGLWALLVTPSHTTGEALWTYLYRVCFELRRAGGPWWTPGAGSAGGDAPLSAFVTSECTRAILTFARGLDQSARLFGEVRTHERAVSVLESPPFDHEWGADWAKQELDRRDRALEISCQRLMPGVFLPTRIAARDIPTRARSAVRSDAITHRAAITSVLSAARTLPRPSKKKAKSALDASAADFAHSQAAQMLEDMRASSKPLSLIRGASRDPDDWKIAKEACEAMAGHLRRFLAPTTRWLRAAIDEQLAAEADPNGRVDAFELTFAAAAHGAITKEWDDARLRRATDLLARLLSERGRFPVGQPIQVREKGYKLHVAMAEALRMLADLLSEVDTSVAPDFVRRMLRLFRDTHVKPTKEQKESRWKHEDAVDSNKGAWWTTALAALALHRIVRMLDKTINDRIARHFSTKRARDIELSLDQLFYADYGLSAYGYLPEAGQSVAMVLQDMRQHVEGLGSKGNWSLILHGPPGTGKSTLVEALAHSTKCTLFEITPSDILVGGADSVERRARVVFRALSMLTESVILFDEFDSIVRERDIDVGVPDGVFEFLTPGMLPKLKTLHTRAKKQRLAFVLATNLIGTLDDAAIREGRFDRKVGVYPPDRLSRAGRLAWALCFTKGGTSEVGSRRFWECVNKSVRGPMSTLPRPGWLTAQSKNLFDIERPTKDGALKYIVQGGAALRWPDPEAERWPRPKGYNNHALREWHEWQWVCDWDALQSGRTLLCPSVPVPSNYLDAPVEQQYDEERRRSLQNQLPRTLEWRELLRLVEWIHGDLKRATTSAPP